LPDRSLCNRYVSFIASGISEISDVQKIYWKVKSGKIFQRAKKVIYSQKETRELIQNKSHKFKENQKERKIK
jgi:hypothetical protein